jgi:hypothetical protein
MSTQYAYSTDQETFHGQHDSVEAALAAAQEDLSTECEPGDLRIVSVGRIVPAEHYLRKQQMQWVGERVVEDLESNLWDDIRWDDTIIQLTPEQHAELGKMIVDWVCANAHFNAYGIDGVQEHSVTIED